MSVKAYGSKGAKYLLIQPVDEHDLMEMGTEISAIGERTDAPFLLVPVPVGDWNADLSPWPAPPVFGNEAFGDGARDMLRKISEEVIPQAISEYAVSREARLILGGYSLAGLFALWSGHETDAFDGIAAASPSVWFPGFLDYAKQRPMRAKAVCLSLGDKEEKTRNPVMRQVGGCIRALFDQYQKNPEVAVTLAWNEGNHFRDAGLRTAKAFAWTMEALNSMDSVE